MNYICYICLKISVCNRNRFSWHCFYTYFVMLISYVSYSVNQHLIVKWFHYVICCSHIKCILSYTVSAYSAYYNKVWL